MATRSRSTPMPDDDPRELLAVLLSAPPTSAESRRPPIALRSTAELRRQALHGFRLRTWVDTWLRHGERLLLMLALLVFGYWFADGPLRDWLHEQQPASAGAPVAQAAGAPSIAGQAKPRATTTVPLPYVAI